MNTGKLELMTTFVRVVETGSFTAVANESGMTQPTVSRQIGALERHVGARLLQRTTRSLTLTEEGRAYYERCLVVLDAVGAAEESVRPGASRVSGTLRVAASLAFGRRHVLPRLVRFLDAWPEVRIDLMLGDAVVDLVEERVDVAVRIGPIRDESLIARRIGETRRVTVASPDYLDGRELPVRPEDLVAHQCIVTRSHSSEESWHYRESGAEGAGGEEGERTIEVSVSGRVHVDASGALPEAVLGGFGIALTPTWQWGDELECGRLVRLLERFEPPPMPIHAVYPSRRQVTPRVRAFIDYLAAEFAADPVLAGRGVASAAMLGAPMTPRSG